MTFRSKYGEPTEELKWKKYRIKVFQTAETHTNTPWMQRNKMDYLVIAESEQPPCAIYICLNDQKKKNTFPSNLFNSQQESLKRFYMMNMIEQNIKLFK